ncbi:MAG: hypothetical protein U0992_09125 [Planctomycetaceae bacterium]
MPENEVCAVDAQFVLDFVVAGRPTLLATDYLPYRVDQWKYDRLIVSRHMIDQNWAQRLQAKSSIGRKGIEADRFACYAEIYESHSVAKNIATDLLRMPVVYNPQFFGRSHL